MPTLALAGPEFLEGIGMIVVILAILAMILIVSFDTGTRDGDSKND